jgi:hypothetical protein
MYCQVGMFSTLESNGVSASYMQHKEIEENSKKGDGYFKITKKGTYTATLVPFKDGDEIIGLDIKRTVSSYHKLYCKGENENSSFIGDKPYKGILYTKGHMAFVLLGNYLLNLSTFNPETGEFRKVFHVYIKTGEPRNIPSGIENEELLKTYATNSIKDFEKINFNEAVQAYLGTTALAKSKVEVKKVIEKEESDTREVVKGGLAIVKKNNNYTIEDANGKTITSEKYSEIKYDSGCDAFVVSDGNYYGLLSPEGEVLFKLGYDYIETTPFNNVKCETQGKQFLITKDKKYRSGNFDQIFELHTNHYAVKVKDKFGLIDTSGMQLVYPIYDRMSYDANNNLVIEYGGVKSTVDYTKPHKLPSIVLATKYDNFHDYHKQKISKAGLTQKHKEITFSDNFVKFENVSESVLVKDDGTLRLYNDNWFSTFQLYAVSNDYGKVGYTDNWDKEHKKKLFRDQFNPAILIYQTEHQKIHLVFAKNENLAFMVDFEEKKLLKECGVPVNDKVWYTDYTKGFELNYIMGLDGTVPDISKPLSYYKNLAFNRVKEYQLTYDEAMKLEADLHREYIDQKVHSEGVPIANPEIAKSIKILVLNEKSDLDYNGSIEVGVEVLSNTGKTFKTKNLGGKLDFAAFELYAGKLEYSGNGVFKIPSHSRKDLLIDEYNIEIEANIRGNKKCSDSKKIALDFDGDFSLDLAKIHYYKSKYTKDYPNFPHRIETVTFKEYIVDGKTVYSVELKNISNNSVSYDSEDDLVRYKWAGPYFFSANASIDFSALRKGSTKWVVDEITDLESLKKQLSITYRFTDQAPSYKEHSKGSSQSSNYSSNSSSSSTSKPTKYYVKNTTGKTVKIGNGSGWSYDLSNGSTREIDCDRATYIMKLNGSSWEAGAQISDGKGVCGKTIEF